MGEQTANTIGPTLSYLPDNRAVRLDNATCVYCGAELTPQTGTKEHVIGRRFVPRGKLHGCWNLIVNACRKCNESKSGLEDDISAITMQPDIWGRCGHEDEAVAAEGRRKAEKSYSRRTKKPVKDSREKMTVNARLGPGINMSFKFTAPPQADPDRVFNLARLQCAGFFYLITYQDETRRGYWWPEGFYPVLEARRSDWGNPVHRAFADAVVEWEPRVLASNADGFYKIALRKHPMADCWSWALEWNHEMRVVGFCGALQAAQEIAARFPNLEARGVSHGQRASLAYRIETPLPEGEDKLFCWDDGTG